MHFSALLSLNDRLGKKTRRNMTMLRFQTKNKEGRVRCGFAAALIWCITLTGLAPMIINAQTQVSGNIHPKKIEIDTAANLTPGDGTYLNSASPGTPVDWQKDTLPNTDPPSLTGG